MVASTRHSRRCLVQLPTSNRRCCCCCFLLIAVVYVHSRRGCQSFSALSMQHHLHRQLLASTTIAQRRPNTKNSIVDDSRIILKSVVEDENSDLTSFDQAGAGIMSEDDKKKLEDMMGFMDDGNLDGGATNYEALRAALRSRTENLGLEKSQVTADYVARRTAEAQKAGSAAAANESNDFFAGLDLSKIRQAQTIDPNNAPAAGDESLPSMFYEVDEMISDADKAIADPVSQLPVLEQYLTELRATKWPTPWAAAREVVVVIVMIALTGYMVLGWDNLVRTLYTDILHFIPSPDELAEYTKRFDELELPPGWTDNMNEDDVAKFSDIIMNAPSEK